MAVQQGMDSARVREIAGAIETCSTAVDDVQTAGTASAAVLRGCWAGDDAGALLEAWQGSAVKRLGEASAMLLALSKELARQADDQDRASDESGGPGPRDGGPGGPRPVDGPGTDGPTTDGPRPGDIDADLLEVLDRGKDSPWVTSTTGPDGQTTYQDPITGRTWVETEDGTLTTVEQTGPFGYSSTTTTQTTDHGDGWETETSTSHGEGPGHESWGASWETSNETGIPGAETVGHVLDNVDSEPIVEQELWSAGAEASVLSGSVGDENLGASGSVLSADASTAGSMGVDATQGAYVTANAQAGAYLAQGEVHWSDDVTGTSAQAEGYLGAQANVEGTANIGPGGAQIGIGGEAFAGGSIEGSVSQDIGDYGSVGIGGELSYGIGAEFDVGAEVSWDEISITGEAGLTLGLGAGVDLDISISPREIWDDITFWD